MKLVDNHKFVRKQASMVAAILPRLFLGRSSKRDQIVVFPNGSRIRFVMMSVSSADR